MSILVMHDLSLHQIQRGWGVHPQGFFLAPYWWIRKKNAHAIMDRISKMGGVKKAFGIPRHVIYEAGSDRAFIRDPIKEQLHEAVSLKPDVIQIHDVPLRQKDTEKDVVEKLAVNRRIIERTVEELKKMKMKNRFMLLGVAHGDMVDTYLEEAKFIDRHCDVVGIPVAAFTGKRKYKYVAEILTVIAKEIRKPIQPMGYGLSNLDSLRDVVEIAKRFDAYIWLEGSSIVRSSFAHRVLTRNPKSGKLSYVNTRMVEGAEEFNKVDCFTYNDGFFRKLLAHACSHPV